MFRAGEVLREVLGALRVDAVPAWAMSPMLRPESEASLYTRSHAARTKETSVLHRGVTSRSFLHASFRPYNNPPQHVADVNK